ncbi:hypothetical protein GQ457_17G003570 [Hibiscus cannabinus]
MHEAEETEEDIVEVTKANVVVDHMVATKQVKTTRQSAPKNKERIHVAVAEEENEESHVFLSYKGNEESKKNIWYLDNCASNHMCGRKEWFVELDEKVRGRVIFGDDSHAEVKGKGKVMITQKNGEKKFITDVYYVPAMKSNIISLGQLLEKGYEVQMKNRSLSLKNKNGELVVQVDMTRNRLFTIDIESGEVKCMKTAIKDDSWLWHLRYGHLGFSGMKLLLKAKMVNGLPEINPPNQLCEACIKGKQHIQSFEVGKSWRARRPLEIIHTDIAGPFDIPSLGGNRYYLTFIDDYSRKCWVYVLKEKSEALAKFKEFKAVAEKQSGQFVKILRSDRGSEYTKNLLEDFCKEHGIIHQLTVRYTPQQNGVAERKNRTILDMERSMVKGKRKVNLVAHIRGVEKAPENSTANHLVKLEARLKVELDTVLSQEKSLWRQMSRANWIENGEHNTKLKVEKAPENSTANHLVKLEVRLKVELDTVLSQEKGAADIALVRWDNAKEPTKSGGLGFHCLRQENMTFMMKIAYHLILDSQKLWIGVLKDGRVVTFYNRNESPHPIVIVDMTDVNGLWDWDHITHFLPKHVLHQIASIKQPSYV